MKAITAAIKWHFSIQNMLLLLAVTLGVVAIAYDGSSLVKGIELIWDNSGYASLALGPLTLLLAFAMLKDGTDCDIDRKTLNRQYAIVASISPMAGFLGTVLGIMSAIQSLGGAENAESLIGMVDQIFGRMGIAFTTTAWGLVLAMIAVLMLRLKKEEDAIVQQPQIERITFLLQEIASSLNDMRPTIREQMMEEHFNGGNRYEKIDM